jgi:hypothetical protein
VKQAVLASTVGGSNRILGPAPSGRNKTVPAVSLPIRQSVLRQLVFPLSHTCGTAILRLPQLYETRRTAGRLLRFAEEFALPKSLRSPLLLLLAFATFCVVAQPHAHAQGTDAVVRSAPQPPQKPESEIIIEGMASYGNYRIFASGTDCKLYTSGIEYDRHIWGYFIGARMDYVAEFLPLVLLNEPAKADIWGNPQSLNRQIVPGIGISPIGLRMMWRSNKSLKPYFTVKGGMLGFTKKAISSQATYENFSLQQGFGLQVRLNPRYDLRLGLFNDFHFSNAFMVPVNPGLDVMNANLGLSIHLGNVNQNR